MNFRSLNGSLLNMALLPLALTGGVWLIWLLHDELSVAVGVGFIALAGVSAETTHRQRADSPTSRGQGAARAMTRIEQHHA